MESFHRFVCYRPILWKKHSIWNETKTLQYRHILVPFDRTDEFSKMFSVLCWNTRCNLVVLGSACSWRKRGLLIRRIQYNEAKRGRGIPPRFIGRISRIVGKNLKSRFWLFSLFFFFFSFLFSSVLEIRLRSLRDFRRPTFFPPPCENGTERFALRDRLRRNLLPRCITSRVNIMKS